MVENFDIENLIHESAITELVTLFDKAEAPEDRRTILIGLKRSEEESENVEYFLKDIEVVSEPAPEDAVSKYPYKESGITFYIADAHAELLKDMLIEYKMTSEGPAFIFSKGDE